MDQTSEFSHTPYVQVNEQGDILYARQRGSAPDSYRRIRLDPLGVTPLLAGFTSRRLADEIRAFAECPPDNLIGAHLLDMLRDELRARERAA
jgi:hypothetical protein